MQINSFVLEKKYRHAINNIPALVQIMAWHRPATSHHLNQWWLDYRHIYPSLGPSETYQCLIGPQRINLWGKNVNSSEISIYPTLLPLTDVVSRIQTCQTSEKGVPLTHCGLVMHTCITEVIIESGNGISPGLCQTSTLTNAYLLSFGPTGTDFTTLWNKI